MEALILETYPLGETDTRVRLLARDGRLLDVRARGSREMGSKLRGGLLPMSVADVGIISGYHRPLARSVSEHMAFSGVMRSPVSNAAARLLVRHVAVATIDSPDPDMYPQLVGMLRSLHVAALAEERPILLYRRWAASWISVLGLLGLRPDTSEKEMGRISSEGLVTLADRNIPHSPEDISILLGYLANHSVFYLPETQPMIAWCRNVLEVPRSSSFATIENGMPR